MNPDGEVKHYTNLILCYYGTRLFCHSLWECLECVAYPWLWWCYKITPLADDENVSLRSEIFLATLLTEAYHSIEKLQTSHKSEAKLSPQQTPLERHRYIGHSKITTYTPLAERKNSHMWKTKYFLLEKISVLLHFCFGIYLCETENAILLSLCVVKMFSTYR